MPSIYPVFDTPVPCPVCKGQGVYCYQDHVGKIHKDECTSCRGSCVMYLTKAQYAKRIGDLDGYTSSRTYATREIDIISKSKDAQSAYRQIVEAGFTDRNYHQVRKYRDRQIARRKKENEQNSGDPE